MRIDGVSRETEPHLLVYINRVYSHYLLIHSMILTGNDHDQMTAASNDYLLRIFFDRVNIPSHLFNVNLHLG